MKAWEKLTTHVLSKRVHVCYKQPSNTHSKQATKMNSAPRTLSLIFHGNCIDGWFSACILRAPYVATHNINYYPISPNLSHTWPSAAVLAGTDILMTDVTVPETVLAAWEGIATSVRCIDHHATSAPQLKCAHREHNCIHDTEACATLLAWRHVFGTSADAPDWVHQIDRIDRWHNVTREDRAIREHLHMIAQLPVHGDIANALRLSTEYITACFLYPLAPHYLDELKAAGETALTAKEDAIRAILRNGGKVITIMPAMAEVWNLEPSWVGKRGFIIDTTGVVLDSTEAGHIAMNDYGAEFFINYRLKTYTSPATGITTKTYIYSARSKETVNLTEGGSILAGHPCSAGASLRVENDVDVVPFVISV